MSLSQALNQFAQNLGRYPSLLTIARASSENEIENVCDRFETGL